MGILVGGGVVPLTLLGLVVMVTPILPESLLKSSAFLLVPAGSCRAGNRGMSMLSLELSESAALRAEVSPPAGVTGDSRPSIELASVSSSTVSRLLLSAVNTGVGVSAADSSWLSSPMRSSPPGSSSTTRLASTCSYRINRGLLLFLTTQVIIVILVNFQNSRCILCPFASAF